MRSVLLGDLTNAARAILMVPEADRQQFCARLLQNADWADCFGKRFRRPHAVWGDGSLMSAARKYPLVDEPSLGDLEYCKSLHLVLSALIDRQLQRRKGQEARRI